VTLPDTDDSPVAGRTDAVICDDLDGDSVLHQGEDRNDIIRPIFDETYLAILEQINQREGTRR
jgi:hypothetical protein